MIIVSISSTEEKFIIQLKHKIDYIVEKKYKVTKSLNKRTIYVFVYLFLSMIKMIIKEVFVRSNK